MSSRAGLLLASALLIAALAGVGVNQALASQATPVVASPVSGEAMVTSTLLRETVEALPPPPFIVGLARWTFDPGAHAEFVVPGPELYIVETGSITLLSGGSTGLQVNSEATPIASPATPTPGRMMRAGDQAAIPADAGHTLRNDGSEPAMVINVVIYPASLAIPSWLPDPETPTGVRIENLAADVVNEPGAAATGPATIVLDRTTLPPGTSQPLPGGIDYGLLVVASGMVELSAIDSGESGTRLAAREVARFTADPPAQVRNAGDDPAVVWVLTISPGEQTGATPVAATPASG